MAERSARELRGIFTGYDIYVIASGPSAGFIETSFFDNKIALGVNVAWKRFPNVDYVVIKDRGASMAAYALGIPVITAKHHCGNLVNKRNQFDGEYDYYVFDHADNQLTRVDLDVIQPDSGRIVVSYSTITSAMHIAAHMGAANIILVGADCGTLDGEANYPGYPVCPLGDEFYRDSFLPQIEPQTIAVRERIKEVYGCNVYSLNPFANFGLEGHRYER